MSARLPPRAVISDAGPLIHLDELGVLDLLADFETVIVPSAVWAEVERHRRDALRAPFLKRATAPPLTDTSARALCVAFSLDAGEIDCLALLGTLNTPLFLCDDAAARLVAERLGYRTHGSIGVLVRSIRRGQHTAEEVLKLLDGLPSRSTLFIHANVIEEAKETIRRQTSN